MGEHRQPVAPDRKERGDSAEFVRLDGNLHAPTRMWPDRAQVEVAYRDRKAPLEFRRDRLCALHFRCVEIEVDMEIVDGRGHGRRPFGSELGWRPANPRAHIAVTAPFPL